MAGIQSNAGSLYNSLTAGSKIIGTIITSCAASPCGTLKRIRILMPILRR